MGSNMRNQNKEGAEFAEYEKYWRKVLVDVLGWRENDFARFVHRRKAWLRQSGSEMFFHDLPYKYLRCELLTNRLRTKFSGGNEIPVEYRLMDALAGGSPKNVSEDNFDVEAARQRYWKMVERLEQRFVSPKPKTVSRKSSNSRRKPH
jgi:hypothetical protein